MSEETGPAPPIVDTEKLLRTINAEQNDRDRRDRDNMLLGLTSSSTTPTTTSTQQSVLRKHKGKIIVAASGLAAIVIVCAVLANHNKKSSSRTADISGSGGDVSSNIDDNSEYKSSSSLSIQPTISSPDTGPLRRIIAMRNHFGEYVSASREQTSTTLGKMEMWRLLPVVCPTDARQHVVIQSVGLDGLLLIASDDGSVMYRSTPTNDDDYIKCSWCVTIIDVGANDNSISDVSDVLVTLQFQSLVSKGILTQDDKARLSANPPSANHINIPLAWQTFDIVCANLEYNNSSGGTTRE